MGNTKLRITKGIISRSLYAGHIALATYLVYRETQNLHYLAFIASIVLLIIEGIVTLYYKKGKELGWFSPSVFFYLTGLVPSIWILELTTTTRDSNFTSECINSIQSSDIPERFGLEQLYALIQQKQNFLLAVEQVTLFILVVGRWLAPLGKFTRNQRSQLLLMYIGTAADIIELFEIFEEPIIRSNRLLIMIIMAVWSWSLLQYTVSFVVTESRKGCCNPDIASPLITLVMQDCPFLVLRGYLLYLGILSPMILFFTAKNFLLIILQINRLIVVCSEDNDEIVNSAIRDRRQEEIDLNDMIN